RVVDHLVDHVMEAGAVVGIADIHARPLADRIEAFEDLDGFRVVFGGDRMSLVAGRFGHCETFDRERGESELLISHENGVSYRLKWSCLRYCYNSIFQGLSGPCTEPESSRDSG